MAMEDDADPSDIGIVTRGNCSAFRAWVLGLRDWVWGLGLGA